MIWKPFKYSSCLNEGENQKEKRTLKMLLQGSVKLLYRHTVKQYNLSSTKDKQKRFLTHPVLWSLRHLTQLTLEVDVYSEVQVPLQTNSNKSDTKGNRMHWRSNTYIIHLPQQVGGGSLFLNKGALLTLFLTFGFMLMVPKISSPVLTVR